MGIRNKLVFCLLAVLLPLVAVSTFATHLLDRQMAERTTAALANTQRLEAARIEQVLDGYARHARSLASDTYVKDLVSKLHNFRTAAAQTSSEYVANSNLEIGGYDNFDRIDLTSKHPLQALTLALQRKAGITGSSIVKLRLVDRDGRTLGESEGFSWTPTDPKLVIRSMRTVKTTFGDAFLTPDKQHRLGIVSPVMSPNGEVVGALLMESRLSPIVSLISKHESMGNSNEAHILQATPSGDAQFITPLRFDRTAAFNKIVSVENNLPANLALQSPESRVIKALDYRGVESFLAIQTITETGWGLIVKADSAEIFAPAIKLRARLRWATLASVGFVALIYLFFLVPIVRRLKQAASAARDIMDGNLSARLTDSSNDEITDLAFSINTLARDLDQDQKKRCEVEARLRHQALHDELTGLLNRKHANKVIQLLTDNHQSEHSVMFLDLNGFKDVNDLYGHAAGDTVLVCVAQRLAEQIPQGGTLARWGGDEFVVILPGADEEQATNFALKLHNVFDEPIDSNEGLHHISCSIGLATSSDDKSLEDALIEADALMYEQKKRLRFQRSKGGMAIRGIERALTEKRLDMWFQPMVKLERPGNYLLIGADTQLRIRSSDGGYVLSDEFMRGLNDPEIESKLDKQSIETGLSALQRWNNSGIVDEMFRLSIKLSAATLNDLSFTVLLENKLADLNLRPEQLQLEMPSEANTLNGSVIEELSSMGIAVALDGVGNEPNLLRDVPATNPTIAIIGQPSLNDTVVLPHLIETCRQLNVTVMARQVANREQLAYLHNLGVEQFQGPLFERAVKPVDFITRWGQTGLTGLGMALATNSALRLAG